MRIRQPRLSKLLLRHPNRSNDREAMPAAAKAVTRVIGRRADEPFCFLSDCRADYAFHPAVDFVRCRSTPLRDRVCAWRRQAGQKKTKQTNQIAAAFSERYFPG